MRESISWPISMFGPWNSVPWDVVPQAEKNNRAGRVGGRSLMGFDLAVSLPRRSPGSVGAIGRGRRRLETIAVTAALRSAVTAWAQPERPHGCWDSRQSCVAPRADLL